MIRELKNSFGSKQVLSGLNLDVFEENHRHNRGLRYG